MKNCFVELIVSCVCVHSCLGGADNEKHENEIELFEAIDENVSYHSIIFEFGDSYESLC